MACGEVHILCIYIGASRSGKLTVNASIDPDPYQYAMFATCNNTFSATVRFMA